MLSTKAMRWKDSGAYRAHYDRALPVDALVAAAMFNGQNLSSYFLPRSCLGKKFVYTNYTYQCLHQSLLHWFSHGLKKNS